MTTPALTTAPVETDLQAAASGLAGPAWLLGSSLLAIVALYFLGLDQGMTSVFGNDMHIHEFVHDSRHFLGFPCH